MRRMLSLPLAALLLILLAVPVLGAPPTIISFADDDVADGDFFSLVCEVEISARSSGHAIFHNETRGANNFISNYNIQIWLTSENGSYHLLDAGPDMEHRRAGTTYFAVTGRSLTFSTVIGRTEVNLDTGETVFHGNLVGSDVFAEDWYAPICDALS